VQVLLRAGIDGIRYPTGTLSGIKESKAFNYVVFDESAATIEEVIRFNIGEAVNRPEVKGPMDKIAQASKSDAPIKEEAGSLMKAFKDRFSTGLTDTDMKAWKKIYQLPYWVGKKFPSVKRHVQAEIKAHEKRSKILYNDYEGDLSRIQDEIPKDKKIFTELKGLIWKWDGRRFPKKAVPTDAITWGDIDTEPIINDKHYTEVEAYLKKQGVSDKAIDAFLVIRKTLDRKLVDIDKTLKIEKLDPTLIEEYRAKIGEIHNYFPHKRTGNAYMQIIDTQEKDPEKRVVYREHFHSFKERLLPIDQKARARGKKYIQEKLGGDTKRYTVKTGYVKGLPDETFFQIPIEAMQQIITVAGQRLEKARVKLKAKQLMGAARREGKELSEKEAYEKAEKIMRADMEKALSGAVAEVLKGRGWARHAIPRKGIPGHETEDVFGILFDYLSGFAGFKTKIERARKHHEILKDIDAKKHPNEWKYASKYVRDVLANLDRTDRVVDGLRAIFFVKYLGFVPKSGLINLTQNIVSAAPTLSVYTKGSHRKLTKAMYDVRKALTSKEAWTGKEIKYRGLKEIEQKALKRMHEEGTSVDLFLRELKGNLPRSGWGKHFRKFVDKSGVFMHVAERFNRASTGLAAFRIAYNEGIDFEGQNTKGDFDRSVEFAKKIIYDTHFLYGKINLPEFARGGDFQKALRSTYTFRSFTHNYISLMAHLFNNQGPAGKRAVAYSLRNLFLTGGLVSVPFFKAFSEALLWALGDDDEDALTKVREAMPNNWLKDMVVYGLPGASAGWDFSGSLSIEVPRNWKDIIGVPYAVIEDSVNTIKSLKSGQAYRALSETPFTPISARNIMRGIELRITGQRTRSGRDISYPTEYGARKISTLEMITKGLGIQPTKISKGYQAYRASKEMEEAIKERKRQWADRYVNAFKNNDYEAMQRVQREVEKWNQAMIKKGKPYLVVNLKSSIQNRLRPSIKFTPKRLRGRVLETYEVWR
jgi:hypothetical protein